MGSAEEDAEWTRHPCQIKLQAGVGRYQGGQGLAGDERPQRLQLDQRKQETSNSTSGMI